MRVHRGVGVFAACQAWSGWRQVRTAARAGLERELAVYPRGYASQLLHSIAAAGFFAYGLVATYSPASRGLIYLSALGAAGLEAANTRSSGSRVHDRLRRGQ